MRRIALFVLLATVALSAQMAPTPSQHSKLVKQSKKIHAIETKINQLRAEGIFESTKFNKLCSQIIMENGWDSSARCDMATASFYLIPPTPQQPPKAAEPVKPPEPEKK